MRQDITEGNEGIALRLNVQVVTADCWPVAGARVDIWQCDAQGYCAGDPDIGSNQDQDMTGQTCLRGRQMADDHGIATFDTIYPGWYRGRTTHIHYNVYLDEKTVLTSQIFLPDSLSEYIYREHPAYTRPEERATIDGIATQAGEGAYAATSEQKDRYIAALVVGVDPDAEWSEGGQGMAGPMGGRPPVGGPPPQGAPAGGIPPQGQGGPQGDPPPGMPPMGGPRGRDETTRIFPEAE